MSEAAAERPTRTQPPDSRGASGNVFTRKFGPLPGWGWAAVAGVAAIGYMWFRNHQASQAGAAGGAAATPDVAAATGDDIQGQLSTIQTEIESLQGEESAEPTGTTSSGSGGGKKPQRTRHVSDGKRSLNEIARSDHTSVADIVSASQSAHETDARMDKLEAWAKHPRTRRAGVVYYT